MNQIKKINGFEYIINIFIPIPQCPYNNITELRRVNTNIKFLIPEFHTADKLGKSEIRKNWVYNKSRLINIK